MIEFVLVYSLFFFLPFFFVVCFVPRQRHEFDPKPRPNFNLRVTETFDPKFATVDPHLSQRWTKPKNKPLPVKAAQSKEQEAIAIEVTKDALSRVQDCEEAATARELLPAAPLATPPAPASKPQPQTAPEPPKPTPKEQEKNRVSPVPAIPAKIQPPVDVPEPAKGIPVVAVKIQPPVFGQPKPALLPPLPPATPPPAAPAPANAGHAFGFALPPPKPPTSPSVGAPGGAGGSTMGPPQPAFVVPSNVVSSPMFQPATRRIDVISVTIPQKAPEKSEFNLALNVPKKADKKVEPLAKKPSKDNLKAPKST